MQGPGFEHVDSHGMICNVMQYENGSKCLLVFEEGAYTECVSDLPGKV